LKEVIKNTTFADRLLLLFLIFASIAGIFTVGKAMSQGLNVTIEIDGKPAYTFPINIDKTIAVSGRYGDSVIEIRDKKVHIREAHCPNQLCVKQGWISNGAIVCLPNRIVVIVGGNGNNPQKDIDAITG